MPQKKDGRPTNDAGSASGGGTSAVVTPSEPPAVIEPRRDMLVSPAEVQLRTNERITALWGNAETRSTWVYVNGKTKRLAANSATAATAMATLAANAFATHARVDYNQVVEDNIETIIELYVF